MNIFLNRTQVNRDFTSEKYRYGMNGQEKDDEVSGAGNSYTAQFWQYDPRIGRRWNVDPVTYPWQSSYSCFNSKDEGKFLSKYSNICTESLAT